MINLIPLQPIPMVGRGNTQLQYHPRYFCCIKPLPQLTKCLYVKKSISKNIGYKPIGDDIETGENYEKEKSVYGRKNSNGVDAP
jgi:hypothetical protein